MKQTYIVKVSTEGIVTREPFYADDSLAQLRAAVRGYIERVPVLMVTGHDLFVNEDGISEKLPFNEKLTRFVRGRTRNSLMEILGDGVFAAHDEEGNTLGLTEEECDDLERAIALAQE